MRARLPRLLLAALCCALCPRPALCATAAAAEPFDTRQVALDEADRIPGLGSLRGSRTQSYWKRRPVYQYQAIPYAEPTSGPKRFLPPEPAAPWTGVLDATALGRRCPQEWEPLSKQTAAPPEPPGGDIEDCLTLNVYAPVRPSTRCDRLLPVMFYIHGGSWRVGSAKDFAPHYLLDRDVLLVKQDLAAGGRATGAGGNHAVVQKAGAQRFLVEHPRHSLRLGRHKRLPVMGGVTKHEGSFFFGNIYDIFLDGEGRMEDADYLRHNLTKVTLEFSGIDDDTGALSDVFREKYFKESDLGNFTLMTPGLIDICGVALLKACTFRMVQENSRLAPSYLYSFNFKGRHTKFGYGYSFLYPFSGVAHSDDLIYLFPDGDLNEEEDATARTMVDLWTNFATFGAPAPAYRVPEWPAVSTEHGPYLRIGREPQVRDNFLDEYHIAVQEGLDAAPHVSGTFATCVIAALFTLAASL
ncbi:Carboxyl/Cholinesterase 26 [Frankliniella occidentalis]|nr:Carboxyl/Cholinesterase 26 [Frankliniella occidentalis]